MAKLIQKSGFLSKKRAGRYMKYIATRDGVEILNEDAEGIYMRYIATRPRAEKHEGHGLFGAEPHVDLEKTMQELKTHEGNVWTIIYSLRREDAARLGYDNAESWRLALLAHQNDFAEAMQIPPEHLHWYAAFHDEGEHPHIHMMLWSDDPQYGFLRKDKLLHMQSVLTNTIYADELKEIYIQKDVAYKEVTEAARAVMRELVDRMESVSEPPASVQQKLLELALELRTVSGKKQYAYLKKPLKDMVDSIVDELETLPEVAAYYAVWNGLRDTLEGYYKTDPDSTIRSPTRKNSARLRMPLFRKRNACGSRWSKCREHQNKNLPRRLHPLTRKLHRTLLQIRRLQMKNFVCGLSFCAASVRISFEFNRQIVPPDGTDLPRQRRAAQQSNGHPHRLQAPQKAHAEAAGDGS